MRLRSITSILLLLSAWPCLAQLPVVPLQRFVASGAVADLSGVAYRWVSCDCPTNVSLASWVDEIQGLAWTNQTSAKQPTNSGAVGDSGVWFDNNHWFTNAGLTTIDGWSNCAFGLIWNVIDSGQFSGETHPAIFNNTAQLTTDNSDVAALLFDSNLGYPFSYELGGSGFSLSSAPFRTTNQMSDAVFTQVMTNTGQGAFYLYTNGILSKQNAGSIGSGYYFGSKSVTKPNPPYPNSLMFNRPRSSSAFARLRELWVWTNGAAGDADGVNLPASRLANFHSYAASISGTGCGTNTPTPQTLGANFWWVAQDLTNNAHVTNWTDRIASSVFTSTSSGYPSNMSDGVHFSLSPDANGLTNDAAPLCTYGAISSHFVIMEFTNNAAFQGILSAGSKGGGTQLYDTSPTLKPDLTISAVTHVSAVAIPQNAFFDICYVSSNSAGSKIYCYTNGVLSDTFSGTAMLVTNWGIMGWAASEPFSGVIKEVAVWSSSIKTPAEISQLHTYATNKYSYTP